MKLYKSVYLLIATGFITMAAAYAQPVNIEGRLINTSMDKVYLVDVSDKAGLKSPDNILIPLNEKQEFNATIILEEPAYYELGKNVLYLSPGDRIKMTIDCEDKTKAVFTGRGSSSCNYLKTIPDFDETGYLGRTYESVQKEINDFVSEILLPKAKTSLQEINDLDEVTNEFRDMEKGRIHSNVVRSLMLYTAGYMRKFYPDYSIADKEDREWFSQTRAKHIEQTRYLLKEFGRDLSKPQYLDLPEFRKILVWVTDTSGKDMNVYKSVTRIDEYRNLEGLLQKYARCFTSFPTDLDPNEILDELETTKNNLQTEKYREVIDKSVSEYAGLRKGEPVFDFIGYDVNNRPVKLSDFKGKYIYLDFWATWCHACIGEYPHFQNLIRQFENREDIVFMTISTDQDKSRWEKYMTEHEHTSFSLHVNRNYLAPFKIAFIPRFILIDKDFTFLDPFAPRPSQPETIELLKNLN